MFLQLSFSFYFTEAFRDRHNQKPVKTMNYQTPNQRMILSPRRPGPELNYADIAHWIDNDNLNNPDNDIAHEIVILDDLECPFVNEEVFNAFVDECDFILPDEEFNNFESRYLAVRNYMFLLLDGGQEAL